MRAKNNLNRDEKNLVIYTTLKKENIYYIGLVTIFIDRNEKILIGGIKYLEKLKSSPNVLLFLNKV
jgi:hypothetical protein